MGDILRKEVLKAFRTLHKARKIVFKGDLKALTAARDRINEEFKQKKSVDDKKTIEQLIEHAHEVAKELRTTVVQAEEKQPGVFQLKITEETLKLDNKVFDPNVEIPPDARKRMRNQKCCQEK
ncbi:hypothetical protein O3M35_001038 [Rhynocoris fuscipes]|uniref:LYR motif-containing protein 7 n=1 Tax=Rhynocoris fuscipes TaxID=488301 RepID=A0AAW1DTU8_9HEMI